MSRILIIGNGFDLALGLRTSYYDFVKSDDFESLRCGPNYLAKSIYEHRELHGWVDIEAFLGAMGKDGNWGNSEKEYDEVCNLLYKYLGKIDGEKSYSPSPQVVKFAKEYLNQDATVFTFNYTRFPQEIFKVSEGEPKQGDSVVKHIHGSIASRNIIFGVNDGMNVDENKAFLYKNYRENFKPMDIDDALESASEIVSFGYSFGVSDHMYFDDFFHRLTEEKRKKKLVFHYYGEENRLVLYNKIHRLCKGRVSYLKKGNDLSFVDSSIH